MKKILIMAVVLLSSVATYAQHAVGSVSVKPEVGMTVASITKWDEDARIGMVAGAEFEYQATDMFSITAGALYSMQGSKNSNYTTKLDYINIPILANVYVAKGLAVKLGIQPGFNVNSEYTSGNATQQNNDFKSVDLSLPVGLSYEINNFVIDGRYNFGMTKVADWTDGKNSVFQFTIGYKFDL